MEKPKPHSAQVRYEREEQTFPRLRSEMCERIAQYGEVVTLGASELVFERGQRSVDFVL